MQGERYSEADNVGIIYGGEKQTSMILNQLRRWAD